MTADRTTVLVLAGVFGSMLGSFLNVVIHRLPRRESIVWPGSHCPACGTSIPWYLNLPLVSYAVLRGRCAACGARISPRYVLVEALAAALAVGVADRFLLAEGGLAWGPFAAAMTLAAALVPVTFIDLEHRIIPDAITKPGMVAALLLSLLAPDLHQLSLLPGLGRTAAALLLSLAGMGVGAGVIWGMGGLGKMVFRKEAMGLGDVKFMGMVGGFTGPVGVLLVLLVACVAGALAGITYRLLTGKSYIPFGPFLSLGTLAVLFFRPEIIRFLTVTYPSWMH